MIPVSSGKTGIGVAQLSAHLDQVGAFGRYEDVQGESGGINTELRRGTIRLILNGALWAFRGIDRPQSGNQTESETRSRDFPWVPSPTNDPAVATWMPLHLRGSCCAYFDAMKHCDKPIDIFHMANVATPRSNTMPYEKISACVIFLG